MFVYVWKKSSSSLRWLQTGASSSKDGIEEDKIDRSGCRDIASQPAICKYTQKKHRRATYTLDMVLILSFWLYHIREWTLDRRCRKSVPLTSVGMGTHCVSNYLCPVNTMSLWKMGGDCDKHAHNLRSWTRETFRESVRVAVGYSMGTLITSPKAPSPWT